MAQKTEIEWTDATWNPVAGCIKVGAGCDNCYAERFAERWRGTPGHVYHAVRFDKLAGSIMEDIPLRMTDMKDVVVKLRAEGVLRFELEGRTTKPQESTLIWRVRS